jgi:hypothetical protein
MTPRIKEWSNDFLILSEDLAGPIALAKKMRIEDEIRVCQGQIEGLRKSRPEGKRLIEMIVSDLNRIQEANSQERAESVLLRNARELSESYQRQAQGYPSNSKALLQEIASYFSLLDIETIAETLEKRIAPAPVDVDEQIEELQMRIEDLKSAPPYHWPSDEDVGEFFRSGHVPTNWRGRSVSATCFPAQIAERICSDFLIEYRTRAVCYLKPVTNVGVLVSTLPEKKKAVWTELYTLLAITPQSRRHIYIPISAAKETSDESVPENPMFKRG